MVSSSVDGGEHFLDLGAVPREPVECCDGGGLHAERDVLVELEERGEVRDEVGLVQEER